MEEVVAVEPEIRQQGETRLRTMDLGHRDRSVEGDHRAGTERQELVVERTICIQSVSAAVLASLWTALIAAWI